MPVARPAFPVGGIASSKLLVSDGSDPAGSLVYTLTAAPAHGTLKNNGSALSAGGTFTQDDINSGLLTIQNPQALGVNNANAIQRVTVAGTVGTFQLTFTYNGVTATTQPLGFNVSPGTVQKALEALPNIGSGNVSVTSNTLTVDTHTPIGTLTTTVYSITFVGTFAGLPVPLMTVSATMGATALARA